MKICILFFLFIFFASPIVLKGEAKELPLPGKEEKKAPSSPAEKAFRKEIPPGAKPQYPGKKKEIKESVQIPAEPPLKKKNKEELFFEELSLLLQSLNKSSSSFSNLWKNELEKAPIAIVKRVLATEKNGIRFSLPPNNRKSFVCSHLLTCRECQKKFKAPPLLHAHRIRNNILLIRIHKWDKYTGSHVGKFLKNTAAKASLILWDLRDCRGDSIPSLIQILSHLKKYKLPSAILISGKTRGSSELFAKLLKMQNPEMLSAGERTSGIPFPMKKKEFYADFGKTGKKEKILLYLPQIPANFSKLDCTPFQPDIFISHAESFHREGKDKALHHICDLFLAGTILEKGNK